MVQYSHLFKNFPEFIESNLRDRVLGEIGKNSFIALPGKVGHSGLVPPKLCVATQEGFVRSYIAMVQGWDC